MRDLGMEGRSSQWVLRPVIALVTSTSSGDPRDRLSTPCPFMAGDLIESRCSDSVHPAHRIPDSGVNSIARKGRLRDTAGTLAGG